MSSPRSATIAGGVVGIDDVEKTETACVYESSRNFSYQTNEVDCVALGHRVDTL